MKLMTSLFLIQKQAFELIDSGVLSWLNVIKEEYVSKETFFLGHAQALAGLCCFIYFAGKAYETLSGDRNWEILPLLRPFGIGLIIMNWTAFVMLVGSPFKSMEDTVQVKLDASNRDVSARFVERDKLYAKFGIKLIQKADEIERFKDGDTEKEGMKFLGFDLGEVSQKIAGLGIIVMSKFRLLIESIIFWLSLSLFRAMLYLVLTLEIFFKYILVVLGPLAFAFSVLKSFRGSGSQWISRYISICFYPILARLMALLSLNLINYALKEDLAILGKLTTSDDAFMTFVSSQNGHIGGTIIISFVIGSICMLTIPSISQWVVQTSGAGEALGKLASGTSGVQGAKGLN